jgi:hypothetical protein
MCPFLTPRRRTERLRQEEERPILNSESAPSGTKRTGAIAAGLLILFGTIVGLLLLEALYRGYLYSMRAEAFRPAEEEALSFGLYDRSLWRFDERHGFGYVPNADLTLTSIADGKVVSCSPIEYINENGNSGPVMATHADPDFTIAVFGDSWTAFNVEGRTWPHYLRDKLETRTGLKINIHNFGRDGTGLIHMFRMAEDKLARHMPDLAIVAFITDDIDRAMFWRTEVTINGELRALTTTEPSATPPLENSADTMMIHPRATEDWCRATVGKRDDLVAEIERMYRERMARLGSRPAEPLSIVSLTHSYLYHRIFNGDAFYFARPKLRLSQNPRLTETDFDAVEGFPETVAAAQSMGIPIKLVHLAIYPELKRGQEYVLSDSREALLESLHRIVGHESLRTTDYIEIPEDLKAINVGPGNYHPSAVGMDFYAEAVARMILRNAWLGEGAQGK